MNPQLQSLSTCKSQTLWLSMLVDVMEKLSNSDRRAHRIDRLELAAFHARLAKPAAARRAYGGRFSLRN